MTSEQPTAPAGSPANLSSTEPVQDTGVQDPPGVEQQREQVAATVDALIAKADVSARAKDAARHQKDVIEQNWRPIAAAVGAAAVVLGTVIVIRRRRDGDRR